MSESANLYAVRQWVAGESGRLSRLHYRAHVSFPTLKRMMTGHRPTPAVEQAVWKAYLALVKEGQSPGG